jgi:hypothetical protein
MGNCIIVFRFVKNRGASKSETRLSYREGKKDERKDIRINDSGWNGDNHCDSGSNS